jgi:8-oxo-dGTP pyrophosphatase MutT (NUDIX family)
MPRMDARWKPNVTVAAVIARGAGDREEFLLVEEETPEGLRLNNPAGHLDPGESPQQGAVREALEETARVFMPDRIVGIYLTRVQRPPTGEDVTYLRVAFGGSAAAADPLRRLDSGIVRTLWLTLDEIRAGKARHRSPLVLRGIEDWCAGRRFPLDLVHCDPSVFEAPDAPDPGPR